MTNSIKEIPEVGVQLPEWLVTLHLYVWQVWGKRRLATKQWVNIMALAEEC